MFFFSRKIQQK